MRRIFVMTMILLMGLRGFVGDAMAVEMLRMHDSQPVAILQTATADDQVAAHPCHSVQEAAADANQDSQGHTSASCTSCLVCHSPALQANTTCIDTFAALGEHGDPQVTAWMSADLVQAQKPPVL